MTDRKKFQWGKLNGSGLRNQRVGLRADIAPSELLSQSKEQS